jgi:hypothetical protein
VTLSPVGLIPTHLLAKEYEQDAINFVLAQAWPSTFKARVMKGWYVELGLVPNGRALQQVSQSGAE